MTDFYKTNLAILPPLKVKNTKYFELQNEDILYKGTWMTAKFEVTFKSTNLHEFIPTCEDLRV
jgi:hypothetical protein